MMSGPCKHFQISIIYTLSTDGLSGKTLDSENGSSGEGSEPDAAKNRSETDLLTDKNGWPMLPTLDGQSLQTRKDIICNYITIWYRECLHTMINYYEFKHNKQGISQTTRGRPSLGRLCMSWDTLSKPSKPPSKSSIPLEALRCLFELFDASLNSLKPL